MHEMDGTGSDGVGEQKLDAAEGMGIHFAAMPDLSALQVLQAGSVKPAQEDGFVLRVSRSGRVSRTRVACQQESPLKGAPLPFTKKRSRGKRSGNSVSGRGGGAEKRPRKSGGQENQEPAGGHPSGSGPEPVKACTSAGLEKSEPKAPSSRGKASRGQDRTTGAELQADHQQQEDHHPQQQQQQQQQQEQQQQEQQRHEHHQQQRRSKAGKSSGSQQQCVEEHQEHHGGRADPAAGQQGHSAAALEVTPPSDKAGRLEEDDLCATAAEAPIADTVEPKKPTASIQKSEDPSPQLQAHVAGPSAKPIAAASDKQHSWSYRHAAPLTALNTGGTGLGGAAKRPQLPSLLKVRPSPRPTPEAKKQSGQGKSRAESGGGLSSNETSSGNFCNIYSGDAPSGSTGGGYLSAERGRESNGAPSGGSARNSGAAMFALSRAQPGLFRVAGLRKNAGSAFKPAGKH